MPMSSEIFVLVYLVTNLHFHQILNFETTFKVENLPVRRFEEVPSCSELHKLFFSLTLYLLASVPGLSDMGTLFGFLTLLAKITVQKTVKKLKWSLF